jgi:hypothetical protein
MSTTPDVTFASEGILDCTVDQVSITVYPELIQINKQTNGTITAQIEQMWNKTTFAPILEKVSGPGLRYRFRSEYKIHLTPYNENLLKTNTLTIMFRLYDDGKEIFKQVIVLRQSKPSSPIALDQSPSKPLQQVPGRTALKSAGFSILSSPKPLITQFTELPTSSNTDTTNNSASNNKRKHSTDTDPLDEKKDLLQSLIGAFRKRREAEEQKDILRLKQIQARIDSNAVIPRNEALAMELEVKTMYDMMKEADKIKSASDELNKKSSM